MASLVQRESLTFQAKQGQRALRWPTPHVWRPRPGRSRKAAPAERGVGAAGGAPRAAPARARSAPAAARAPRPALPRLNAPRRHAGCWRDGGQPCPALPLSRPFAGQTEGRPTYCAGAPRGVSAPERRGGSTRLLRARRRRVTAAQRSSQVLPVALRRGGCGNQLQHVRTVSHQTRRRGSGARTCLNWGSPALSRGAKGSAFPGPRRAPRPSPADPAFPCPARRPGRQPREPAGQGRPELRHRLPRGGPGSGVCVGD